MEKNGQSIVIGFCFLYISLLINPMHILRSIPVQLISTSNSIILIQQKPWGFDKGERYREAWAKTLESKTSLKPSNFCHSGLIRMPLHIMIPWLTHLSPFSIFLWGSRNLIQISSLLWMKAALFLANWQFWTPGSLFCFLITLHPSIQPLSHSAKFICVSNNSNGKDRHCVLSTLDVLGFPCTIRHFLRGTGTHYGQGPYPIMKGTDLEPDCLGWDPGFATSLAVWTWGTYQPLCALVFLLWNMGIAITRI